MYASIMKSNVCKYNDSAYCRYATQPSLVAIELMNEPLSPGINLDDLKKFYKDRYDAVRKYTKDAYVIFSNRLGGDLKELISFSSNFGRVVIDFHMYNLFWEGFNSMTVQQNIDFIYNNRASAIKSVSDQGPLVFIGKLKARSSDSNCLCELDSKLKISTEFCR